MYVKNNFSYSILDLIPESEVFESLFIKIQNKHNPIDEFNLILQTFEELSYRAYICGDYNIDLLQIENSNKVNLFYQNMSMSGFFPKITLPTRLSETTCTLIDNVITNNIDNNHLSRVLTRKISDHQMKFCMINHKRTASNSKGKFMEVENNTGNTLENFQNYLFEKNIIKKMDHNISSDPNANCDILFENNCICPLNESSLTKENIKFNHG